MGKREEILSIVSVKIRSVLECAGLDFEQMQELRLRVNKPLAVRFAGQEYFLSEPGQRPAYRVTERDIKETLQYISSFSLYAYEDEIRQGFITVQGGHRVGLAGKAVIEQGIIKSVKHISFINIRVAHEKKGCGTKVLPYLYEENRICHTLIISPPGCGKTTLLRDIVRLLSDGDAQHAGVNVGVVDERSEIAACYLGTPQNDVGMRTDVLDGCPKAEGMLMLIRSMAPAVIAVDEIGKQEDIDALAYVMNCGCSILATVHGASLKDLETKPVLYRLVEERLFRRFIVLSGYGRPGRMEYICDEQGMEMGGGGQMDFFAN